MGLMRVGVIIGVSTHILVNIDYILQRGKKKEDNLDFNHACLLC